MNCDLVKKNLAAYLDGVLSPKDSRAIEEHCAACPACAAMLEEEQLLQKALASLPAEELPEGFKERFRARLAAEPPRAKRSWYARPWVKALGGVAAAACLMLVLGAGAIGLIDGMGGMAKSEADMAYYDTDMMLYASSTSSGNGNGYKGYDISESVVAGSMDKRGSVDELKAGLAQNDGIALASEEAIERKIIRDAEMRLTVEDFAAAYAYIEALPEQYGGYLVSAEQSHSGSGRYTGTLVLRVDAGSLDDVLALIGELGQVSSQNITSADVTAEYYDIQNSLAQYREHEARLMELIDEAKSISDLLQLEEELNRVRIEIETMEGRLRYYDQVTELSKITVHLYSAANTGSSKVPFVGWSEPGMEMRNAFMRGINSLLDNTQNLLVFFLGALPTLAVLGVIIGGVVYIIRRRRK